MQKKVQIIPSVFTEAVYLIEGKPFSFQGREYLKTLYDMDISYGLMKTGRQVEKSTTLSIKIANDVQLQPFSRDLYVAPRTEQVKTFSKERLAKLLRYSKENIVKRFFMSSELTDQVYMREFVNGSTLWLRHCFDEGDNIRGLSIDHLFIDEIQDIIVDAIPVIQETQFASDSPSTWFTGTPKTFGNTIESLWQNSSKGEWIVKCSHCNQYQILGIKNITPTILACRKCARELTREMISEGFWLETSENKDLKGFHISQMMSPRAKMYSKDGKGIYQKMINYPIAKFHNEVLGLSYENADKLITDTDLDAIMDNEYTFYSELPGKFAQNKVYAGVDWGTGEKSFTILTIFTWNEDHKFQLLYTKKYEFGNDLDKEHQIRHIIQLINLFRVNLCVVDWGFGYTEIQKLRKELGHRIAVCRYVSQQHDKIVYESSREVYNCRRTDVLMDYITDMIHHRKACWPGNQRAELKFMRDHHLCEQAQYRKTQNGRSEEMYLDHPMELPDDGFHSCAYSYIAYLLDSGGVSVVRALNRTPTDAFEFPMVYTR